MPYELQVLIATWLPASELLRTLQLVSKQWRQLVLDSYTWRLISESLPMQISIRRIDCIAERRSKGKMFKAMDRLTGKLFTLRKMELDVTNAGMDDGFPTSVLRELTNLNTMSHPNIAKVFKASVKG